MITAQAHVSYRGRVKHAQAYPLFRTTSTVKVYRPTSPMTPEVDLLYHKVQRLCGQPFQTREQKYGVTDLNG